MDFKSILRRIIEYNTEKSSDPELIINDFDPPANKTEIDVPCKKWIGSLNRIRDTIKTFISQTEGDFLCLGKALQDFYNDAEKISAISLSATNLISGDETAIAIDRLQGILDRINGYFEDLNHRSVQKKGSIGHILNIFDSINGAFEGFMKIVKVLNILGISIKIESTRFTDKKNNFNILADNVRELSGFINSKSSDMLDGSISISNTIKKTFSEIITFEYKQFNQAKEILNNIKTNRLLLKERYDLFSAASKQISARSNEISGSIGEIVTFIQFHDITRQEIEHVKEAIDDLILRLNNGHSTDDESEIPDCTNFIKQAHIVSDTCKLQISQLHHASDEMVVAVEKII
ncbi:MAG: hypothetical protein SV062_08625, partial [Thermodesulfobacteriota bacterium]|nr:hypothetical protein [Thermodesulfobacteriota bacterium]